MEFIGYIKAGFWAAIIALTIINLILLTVLIFVKRRQTKTMFNNIVGMLLLGGKWCYGKISTKAKKGLKICRAHPKACKFLVYLYAFLFIIVYLRKIGYIE